MLNIKFKGLKREFAKLHDEVTAIVSEDSREAADELLSQLKAATPVDKGHARDSWRVDEDYVDPVTQETRIAIINDAEYIDELNRGTSRQAPARFIEREALKLFEPNGVVVTRSDRS
jgi:hypothetical protein